MVKTIKHTPSRFFVKYIVSFLFIFIAGLSSCGTPIEENAPISPTQRTVEPTRTPAKNANEINSRGYLTTPQELKVIAEKAEQGLEPYKSAVVDVLQWANKEWVYEFKSIETCDNANEPVWNDNGGGTPVLYAKAIAYHLTGDVRYAEEVKNKLEQIMTEVKSISVDAERCQLVFSWGTPELVASADLIEAYWKNQTCTGPVSTEYADEKIVQGNCKVLFQNWLVKNPYYVVSLSAENSKSNWGAAATNATAYIADYLWDRSDILLIHRNPPQIDKGKETRLTPSEAYTHANKLALDRMNGYGVEHGSIFSCDFLDREQQSSQWTPVKSQISEMGIIPEDARRQEYCNIPSYNGEYQNYPQIHLGSNIQQCELMLRRGDDSCFDNVARSDIPGYTFKGPDGKLKTTHLYPGRGSIERAIKAIIVDTRTEWRHDSALSVAFRYYYNYHTLPGFEQWAAQLSGQTDDCGQDICFGTLTHGFSIEEEIPNSPPTVPPP